MKIIKYIGVLTVILSLSGCAGGGSNENWGTVLGGIGGALLGSTLGGGSGRDVAIAAGAIGGAYVGNQVGKSMDKKERRSR